MCLSFAASKKSQLCPCGHRSKFHISSACKCQGFTTSFGERDDTCVCGHLNIYHAAHEIEAVIVPEFPETPITKVKKPRPKRRRDSGVKIKDKEIQDVEIKVVTDKKEVKRRTGTISKRKVAVKVVVEEVEANTEDLNIVDDESSYDINTSNLEESSSDCDGSNVVIKGYDYSPSSQRKSLKLRYWSFDSY